MHAYSVPVVLISKTSSNTESEKFNVSRKQLNALDPASPIVSGDSFIVVALLELATTAYNHTTKMSCCGRST